VAANLRRDDSDMLTRQRTASRPERIDVSEPTQQQSTSVPIQAAEGPSPVTAQPRPPLVRSTVYVLRALVGSLMVVVGMLLLLIFDNALLGVREDLATIQADRARLRHVRHVGENRRKHSG